MKLLNLQSSFKYKEYWRKAGLKKYFGQIFIDLVKDRKPKNFLEIGVFTGVTARNICELLSLINNRKFYQNEPVLVIHADNLSIFPLKKFIDTFIERNREIEITMMTYVTDTPESCGIVRLNQDGIVTKFYEKSQKDHGQIANGAIYIVSPNVLNFIESLKKNEVEVGRAHV